MEGLGGGGGIAMVKTTPSPSPVTHLSLFSHQFMLFIPQRSSFPPNPSLLPHSESSILLPLVTPSLPAVLVVPPATPTAGGQQRLSDDRVLDDK
ncbi:hypothetical protein E2C01_036751 [Portunus trituberculatus]|uniref:Uncharacterized protein n=1 Tax=Portunus trituberculatus TaxID=210409 RepID=A0A5B7FF66_PORTR|nr:hypothetical protein [Portunus trituberculatus]